MATNQFILTGDFAKIEEIAMSENDRPVLMVNLNECSEGEYPNWASYKDYMKALDSLLEHVGGNISGERRFMGSPGAHSPWMRFLAYGISPTKHSLH